MVKNPLANARVVGWIPGSESFLEKKWQPTPVFLTGKSHGQRSLAGDGPRRLKVLDLILLLSNNSISENGNSIFA